MDVLREGRCDCRLPHIRIALITGLLVVVAGIAHATMSLSEAVDKTTLREIETLPADRRGQDMVGRTWPALRFGCVIESMVSGEDASDTSIVDDEDKPDRVAAVGADGTGSDGIRALRTQTSLDANASAKRERCKEDEPESRGIGHRVDREAGQDDPSGQHYRDDRLNAPFFSVWREITLRDSFSAEESRSGRSMQ